MSSLTVNGTIHFDSVIILLNYISIKQGKTQDKKLLCFVKTLSPPIHMIAEKRGKN